MELIEARVSLNDDVIKSDGKKALEQDQAPVGLLGTNQNANSGKIVFDKADGEFFKVLIVNRSQQGTEVKIELHGR